MSIDSKKYDAGDIVDVVGIYQNKIELMHYMLETMRSELNTLKNGFNVSELNTLKNGFNVSELNTLKNGFNVSEYVLNSSFKCLEVLEQLSFDNLNYVHEEVVKYKTEWENEK